MSKYTEREVKDQLNALVGAIREKVEEENQPLKDLLMDIGSVLSELGDTCCNTKDIRKTLEGAVKVAKKLKEGGGC